MPDSLQFIQNQKFCKKLVGENYFQVIFNCGKFGYLSLKLFAFPDLFPQKSM